MGTHPIFESDFDCLTEMVLSSDLLNRIDSTKGSLDLSGLALAGSIDSLAEVLQSRDVTHLNLSDCMLSSVAASKLLTSLSGLISLELRGNDLRGDAINTLAALVRRCSLLHTLNLEWNSLGQTDVEFNELCNAISNNRNMINCDFRNNQLTNAHGVTIANLIATNPTIKCLDLRWNRIGSTAGREIVDALKHNNTIENVLLDGNGLTHDLIEAIRLICDRNSTNHQLQEKTKMQTSFLLQELENTKTLALDQSARFENEIDISRQEKIQLEANLWANKNVLVELRSKLEIAESTIQEKEALLNDIHQEFEFFKKESRETQSLMQLELENTKTQSEQSEGKRMDEIGFLKKKNIEFESELNEARRDIDSYRQQIENMNKNLKKERENFQETKEGEERHFQRNIVRLNEEIERERMFRKMQEDEAVKLREQLAESTRQYKAMEDKHQVTLRETEHEMNERRENLVTDLQTRLAAEKESRAESERANHVLRSQQEDMKVRLATMEESRERLNNQHRELEISIDPMRRELENCKNHIIQMKEDKINEIAELNKRIQLQSDELLKAQTELRAYKDLQRQKDESLRSALNQYFH